MSKWHNRFMALADHVSTWTKDPNKGVGAVIVDDKHRVLGIGYNGFPRGVKDLPERYADRELKHDLVCHAERNALDNYPAPVDSCTMYASYFPCSECAKSIAQRGITTVISRVPDMDSEHATRFKWDITHLIFKEAGIRVLYYVVEEY